MRMARIKRVGRVGRVSRDAAPHVVSATVNAAGTTLTVVFTQAVSGFDVDESGFVLRKSSTAFGGNDWLGAYSSGTGTNTIVFSLLGGFPTIVGNVLFLDYVPGPSEFNGTGSATGSNGIPLSQVSRFPVVNNAA